MIQRERERERERERNSTVLIHGRKLDSIMDSGILVADQTP